jgi:hypothetical protein
MNTCGENKRHGFLEEDQEGEERGISSSFSIYGSKKPARDFWLGYSRTKMPRHSLLAWRDSLCLCVSSRTRRVVNFDFRYYLMAGVLVVKSFLSELG